MANKRSANGEGSITYLKNKKIYQGKITVGRKDDGKLIRKTVYGKSREEVSDKITRIKYSLLNGKFVGKSNITFYKIAKEIADDKLNLNIVKETSYTRILSTIKILEPLHNIEIQKLNENLIKKFSMTLTDYAQSTIDKVFFILNSVFKEAIRKKLIVENPMDSIRKPRAKKAEKKIRALTIEEEQKLLNVLVTEDINYSQQMLISLFTGMRMGEINALEVKDININKKTIKIHKTIGKLNSGKPVLSDTTKTKAGTREIFMSEDIIKIFEDAIGKRKKGLIFTSNNKIISTSQVYCQFRRTMAKYDIIDPDESGTVTLHSLRHTYATRCIESGMQPKVLQKLLGHTDITTTMNTYCDAFDGFTNQGLDKANEYFKNIGLKIS